MQSSQQRALPVVNQFSTTTKGPTLRVTATGRTDRLTALQKKLAEVKSDGASALEKLQARRLSLGVKYELLARKFRKLS